MESFETMLTGGHPNSLGKTIEVVDIILEDKSKLEELYQCYFSNDEVVRLRTSNAFKRICKEDKSWLTPYIDKFLEEISKIDQASTQWTIAQLFLELTAQMSTDQIGKAKTILKKNLINHNDWIVLNTTIKTLASWSKKDPDLKKWIKPHLDKISMDSRKSVSSTAKKAILQLYKS
ncbi:hypothetical protein [Aquimarina mytili]|uniref:Uncharacterized protein n=1 Tax=Aquimarina mytili TaxID=874423 RepID=A0A937DA12_9FLAO|nr:hypothetical protein [Aquimarina mytili]MBL0685555.1 hypothetical protein [Aquimarina mytili]